MYGRKLYRAYVRVYLPAQSRLQYQADWDYQGTGSAFGRLFAGGYFVLNQGQTHTITLTWQTPRVASQQNNHWNYQYVLQRQAGIQRTIHVQVALPPCNATLLARNTGIPLSKHLVSVSQLLNKDQTIMLSYECG
jgi:hypothetical protein